MEQRYLIDTNVLIDSFGGKVNSKAKLLLNSIQPIISAVTKIELLGWRNASPQLLKPLQQFVNFANVLPINDTVIDTTIIIRQKNKIKLGDAIIAATALTYNLTIITRNISDFKNITGVKVINPFEL